MTLATNKHNLALGRAVTHWSEVEGWIFYIFSIVSRTDLDVAYTIMASFGGFGPQRDLFERVVKLQVRDPELLKLLLDACKEYDRLTPQRNKIVHGEWVTYGNRKSWKTVRVGKTKQLRYFDKYKDSGEDPQKAVFTVAMLDQFAAECIALRDRMSKIADHPTLKKDFPIVW